MQQVTGIPVAEVGSNMRHTPTNEAYASYIQQLATVWVPDFENQFEVQMSAERALQVQSRPVKWSKVVATLLYPCLSLLKVVTTPRYGRLFWRFIGLQSFQYQRGKVNMNALFIALKDKGFVWCTRSTSEEGRNEQHVMTWDLKLKVKTAFIDSLTIQSFLDAEILIALKDRGFVWCLMYKKQ